MIEFNAGNEEVKKGKLCPRMCVCVGVLESSENFTEIQTSTTKKKKIERREEKGKKGFLNLFFKIVKTNHHFASMP